MHTRAALPQTFHEHLLACVKQTPPRGKSAASLLAVFLTTLLASSCATLPRQRADLALKPARNPTLAAGQGLPININKATARELEELPGIGRGIAERIIAHREQYGGFRRAEHLMMVRGISDRKFRALQPMITVE